MIRNPEFVRNLWLEFKGHRLVAVPVALGAIFLLAALTDSRLGEVTAFDFSGTSSRFAAKVAFIVIVVLWGSRMAAEAVVQEINARTWDGQRMSAIGPWSMVWGKLFGSTSFAWFCGGLCLLFYAVVSLSTGKANDFLWESLILIQAALVAHVVALLFSLIALQKGRTPGRSQVTIFQFTGISAGVVAGQLLWGDIAADIGIDWFGMNFVQLGFMYVSILAFGIWFVVGCYQLMRQELQVRTGPVLWLGFVLFSMVYVLGFGIGALDSEMFQELSSNRRFFGSYLVGLILLYGIALAEPKDHARLRQLGQHMRLGERRKAFDLAPRTLLTLPIVAAFGMVAMMIHDGPSRWGADSLLYIIPATFFFAIRDAGFIYAMNISRPTARANVAAAIYLVLIYGVAPSIFDVLGLDAAVMLFRPGEASISWPGVIAPFIEAGVITAILVRLFRRTLGRVTTA